MASQILQKKLASSFLVKNRDLINRLKPRKNDILFSKDGSVGQAYCLKEDADLITSGAILRLTVKSSHDILPEYLTLVLNSLLVKMQADRDIGGSIIMHWRIQEIRNILIPIIEIKTQTAISDLVQESFKLKSESEKLLALAKQAVEVAIEQSEEEAMKLFKSL